MSEKIWEALGACFAANNEPMTKAQVVAWVQNNYSDEDFNSDRIAAQLYRSCANVASMARFSTPKFLSHDRRTHTYSLAVANGAVADSGLAVDVQEAEQQAESKFPLEKHLQQYLARNLFILEKGLRLWDSSPPSVEYFVGGRRIDILAQDAEGNPVVIELKRDVLYDEVIGQALLYQGLIARKLKRQKVRIILVGTEISEDLKIACSRISDILLFEYSISMQVKSIDTAASEED